MLMTESYTPQCIRALIWFASNEPGTRFDRTAPNKTMRSSLERRGLIERIDGSRFKCRVTERGHHALREASRTCGS